MGVRLFTDKLVFRRLEVPRGWLLDSATPSESAYPAHASRLKGGAASWSLCMEKGRHEFEECGLGCGFVQ
jgi:hypothetical protein